MPVRSYLFFDGRCEEALDFYRSVVDLKVNMKMRFSESPDAQACKPGTENMIMHASVTIGGTEVFMSDGRGQGKAKFEGVSLAYSVKSEAEADRLFTGLSAGGFVTMPLSKTFFSPRFGMVTDKFGLGWLIMVGD